MTFLSEPAPTPAARQMYEDDLADDGFVMDLTRLWAHRPDVDTALRALLAEVGQHLTLRQRAVLVAATAAALGDSYCSLAWGGRLADEAGADVASAVLGGVDDVLEEADRVLARWARLVVEHPNDATPADVEALRATGHDDPGIFAITTFVALRLAFSTVNDALGARPDAGLVARVEPAVATAVTWGRAPRGA